MKNILLIEDEENLNRGISLKLKKEGYAVFSAACVSEGLKLFQDNTIDLVICDIGLPDGSGLDLCANIRQRSDVLFLFLTALDTEVDVITGYEMGADDYVTKPFDPDELLARVKTILKRYSINSQNIVQIQDVIFDGDKYEIRYHDETLHLPLKQFELAFELAKNPNQIFTREQLIEKIWGMDYDGFDRTVDVHIKRIRENLGHLPGFKVVTVRGLGYKIEVEQ